ncbi:putative peptidase [Pseudobythopirellula maris]|uniref:Putative peptidase n=1 Tax=Pseudobythopirellula maris TaxID=2527991 RepID=A0A5C5ZKE7_9BACT|nr:Xaa-Pro peptidase family protein [Pseudobythopirellula maris]TWT87608.1 putative peptidase [Pseudobythopirellula maris]
MTRHTKRRDKLRKTLRKEKVDALLVTNFTNVTYLTGFFGDDSYLLVTPDDELLVSDARFTTQIEEECPGLATFIRQPGERMTDSVADAVGERKIERLGVEADSMTLGLRNALADKLTGVDLAPTSGLVEGLRLIKDRDEIDSTRAACMQAKRAFEVVRAGWDPAMTELDVAHELERQARRFGATKLSFPPIIAVGERAALPHAIPTDKKIGDAPFTLIDWGADAGPYISDLTRMVCMGKPSVKFTKIYNLVLKAQVAAIEAIRPGAICEDVDAVARKIITRGGFGKEFGHGLGHGTGLEVHEAPRFSRGQKTELRPGMIVTVEPGIYLPGWGGVRIEDDILVTKTGFEVLTDVPKRLEECVV